MPTKRDTLGAMTRSPYLTISCSQEIKDAVRAYCESQDPPLEVSEFIRTAICKAIGKPKLAKKMREPGRPKSGKGNS